jgi:outer membrane biosynthesis protein TonB
MTFNAYHKWLGIPPEEQPPNHYRLLGIKVFETDPDVIASAADRQMAHVRTFQSGLHSAESQRVLNEISTARVALLNSAKKAEYDRQLQQHSAQSKPAPQETADLDFLNAPAAPGAMPAAGPKPKQAGSKPQAWIGLAVAGVLVVLAGIWAVNLGRNKNEVASVEPKSPAADRATGEPAGTEPKRKPELPPPPPPPKPQPQDAPKPKPEPRPQQKPKPEPSSEPEPKPEPISPAPLVAPKTPEEEIKPSQENEAIRWPRLTRFLNDMSHWHVEKGTWRSENGRIVGSDDCILVFNHHLPDDFVLELTMNVIDGMRPRVHLPGFHVGNEGYSKTISLFDVDDAVGRDFPYDNKQTMRLRIVAGDNVQLYVNGALVKEGKRRAARAGDLRISGGDFWSRGTTAFSDFTLGSSQDEASPVSEPKAEETKAAAKAAGETAAEATTHKAPAKHSAARLISSLKKKLRGKLVYDPRTEQFTLTYDWASKQQLQDFDLSKAKLPFVRGRLALQGGESIRHAVDFKEVTIGALVFVPAMKGTLIRTSGGLQARVGGQWPDTMYLDGGGGDNPSLVVPDSQRKGIQPIVVTITETHLGFAYGSGNPSQLGKAVTDFHAGQVELSGGDVGFQYGKLVLTGLIDDKWLRSYVEE